MNKTEFEENKTIIIRQSYFANFTSKILIVLLTYASMYFIEFYSLIFLPILGFYFLKNYMTKIIITDKDITYETLALTKQDFDTVRLDKIYDIDQLNVSLIDRLTGNRDIRIVSLDGTFGRNEDSLILRDFNKEVFLLLKDIASENY